MAYRVELTPLAQEDLKRIYATVVREAPYRGPVWFDRFERAILSLSNFPERCMIVPSLSTSEQPVRQLLFGRRRRVYRIYFAVFEGVVRVVHVRHGARKEPRRL